MILKKIKIAVFSSLFLVLANSNVKAQCSSPSLVTSSPAQLCAPGGTTNLNATSNIGTSIAWYTVAVGGTSLGSVPSGSNFNVNSASTTTFYAEAFLVNSNNNQVFNYTGAILYQFQELILFRLGVPRDGPVHSKVEKAAMPSERLA